MGFEQKINYHLNKYPRAKKKIKSIYQHIMYAVSPKIKSEGEIIRLSPDDSKHEYFFGYYDKSPWDYSDRYVLCLKATNTWTDVSPKEVADILLIDTKKSEDDPKRVVKIAETHSWNVQQACMLQWLGPEYCFKIIYNDFQDGGFVSVIQDVKSGEKNIIPAPIYTVSSDGKIALSLDFSRLYNLRPGYGYYNMKEKTEGQALPDEVAIWKIDLVNKTVTPLLSYIDFASFQPRIEMKDVGAVHKVNHLMINPSGTRFMVLYRWFVGERKYTRLITCNIDGTDMYVLSDDDMVSHCYWKDDNTILAFENKKDSGSGYYLMRDRTQKYIRCWPELNGDGHPSYNPDRSLIVTDSYPDRKRIQYLRIMKNEKAKPEIIAKVFSPFKYDNDTRCDLHPRWNHNGNMICFDSVFEGHRGLYAINVPKNKNIKLDVGDDSKKTAAPKFSIVTPMYNSFSLMKHYFDSLNNQKYKNFEIIIVDDCSTDGSYEKACTYARSSLLAITVCKSKSNGGPGNARNIGIRASKGEWIIFVDSDDALEHNCLSKINSLDLKKADIVLFDYYRIIAGKKEREYTVKNLKKSNISREEAIICATTNVCGKAYKASRIRENKIEFPPLYRYEDWVFFVRAISLSNLILYLDLPLYDYIDNVDSIVHTRKDRVHEYSMKALSILDEELSVYPNTVKEALYLREVLYVVGKQQLSYYNSNEIKDITDYMNRFFPRWRSNLYIKSFSRSQNMILNIIKYRMYYLLNIIGKCLRIKKMLSDRYKHN